MKKGGVDVWDIILYVLMVIFLGWVVLKAFGVIHSPVWVDMIPYFSIGIIVFGGIYKLGKIKQGIEDTEQKVDTLLGFEKRFSEIEHEHELAMDGKLNIKH